MRVRWSSADGDELTLLPGRLLGRTAAVTADQYQLRAADGTLRGRGRAVGEWLGGWIEGEFVTAAGACARPQGRRRQRRWGARDYYRVEASRPSTGANVSGRADSAGDFNATFAGRMDL